MRTPRGATAPASWAGGSVPPARGGGERGAHLVNRGDPGLTPDSLSYRGNAKLFADRHRHDFRHVPGLGWYRWSGHRWEADDSESVLWAAGALAEALAETDPTGRHTDAALRRHRRQSLSTPAIRAMLEQVQAAPAMVLSAALLDADPHSLCTPGGVVDLATGEVSPPDPERHLHSRATTVPVRAMPIPRWERFLRETLGEGGDGTELIGYLHRLLGYSLTGDVEAQVLPFLHGLGHNGKSVLLGVVLRLLGDYADAAPPGFLMAHEYEEHPTDLAELQGRRVVVCAEPRFGDRLDAARATFLTGGDRIKARRSGQGIFGFDPTHKLWRVGNHRPEVSVGDPALWRRIRVIPFRHVVTDERRLDNLAEVLVAEEGPGILHRLVTGAGHYARGSRDLTGPSLVRQATAAYVDTEDHVGRFLAEHRADAPSGTGGVQSGLYALYRHWCRLEGCCPAPPRAFAARLQETAGARGERETFPAHPHTSTSVSGGALGRFS
ncbi:DNA primase [Streptomyces sp. CB01373]|nr:DNA primase [Streptomyces sp. CB01373]